jgi:hypothetical protein
METNIYDIGSLVFVYENLVSFTNNVCLDIDVINKLNKFQSEGKINDSNIKLFKFLLRRTYLSLVITLDSIVDDPNKDKPIDQRIRNNGINIDKLLNLLQDHFRNVIDQKTRAKLNKNYNELRKEYERIVKLEGRKKLTILRDKLVAHFDYKYIKKDEHNDIDFSYIDTVPIINGVLFILDIVESMIATDKELMKIQKFDSNRETPIDNLFI